MLLQAQHGLIWKSFCFWKGLYRIRILQVYMQLPYSDVAFIYVHGNQLMTRNALITMFTRLSEKGDLLHRGGCKKLNKVLHWLQENVLLCHSEFFQSIPEENKKKSLHFLQQINAPMFILEVPVQPLNSRYISAADEYDVPSGG